MDIIVRGEPHELDFVRRLCRDKVRRGVLAILPATGPASDEVVRLRNERDETKREITTLREYVESLEKGHANMSNAQHDLAGLVGLAISVAIQSGAEIPEDITAKCAEFGIIVPTIEETAENSAESVPETDNPEPMDDKHIGELEDLQEVDLEADDKTPATDDTKNVPVVDVKGAKAPRKASKRSKKSE